MKIFLFICLCVVLVLAEDSPIGDFTAGNKLFTQDVYNQLLKDNDENILVSPFSAEIVLGLTQSGAAGATGEEIRTTLHLAESEEGTQVEFKSVLPTIHSDYVTLVTVNKIYVENSYPIKETFKKVAADVYQAEIQNVEFTEAKASADEINKWVEEHTNNKIKDVVSPDDLDHNTKIVLVNALYFHGNWSKPFDIEFTKTAKFFTSEETSIDAESVFKTAELYNYAESVELDAKILEIPFQGFEAVMTFVLPNKKEGIAILEKKMDTVLKKPKYSQEIVQVQLPKFKIESTIDFKQLLIKLGVGKAFNPLEADFSGIAGVPGELFIDEIKQKTFLELTEVGVEAAAATEAGGVASVVITPDKYFIADHPFVFYLSFNDIVLFEGRVLNPES